MGSNTEGGSRIVNYYLNPLNRKVDSYLEDGRHMLVKVGKMNRTQAPFPPQTRIVVIDAIAMYPSIPPEEGVESSEKALTRSGLHSEEFVDWVIRLLICILEYNVIE